jgi:hypothetical protein
MQAPLQATVPVGQVTQLPCEQVVPSGQTFPQAPQLSALDCRSTQPVPEQKVRPLLQMHVPFEQTPEQHSWFTSQLRPYTLQQYPSLSEFTQIPEQHSESTKHRVSRPPSIQQRVSFKQT